DGIPGSAHWNPAAQAATVSRLIAAGADPDARDGNGATPLHRAARTRCAVALRALLDGGADAGAQTPSGATPRMLAERSSGRGGTGAPEAHAGQAEILRMLDAHGMP
ncbi:MAG: ankyrin repeat domain-containing protein, partial [Pseudomonadota bacterium]